MVTYLVIAIFQSILPLGLGKEANQIWLPPIPLCFFCHCLKTFEIGSLSLGRVVKQDLTPTYLSLSGKSPVIDRHEPQTWAASTLRCRHLLRLILLSSVQTHENTVPEYLCQSCGNKQHNFGLKKIFSSGTLFSWVCAEPNRTNFNRTRRWYCSEGK